MSARILTPSRGELSGWDALDALFTLDLLGAAWNWDIGDFRRTTGFSREQLRAFRNHDSALPQELAQLVDRLMALHRELWMSYPPDWDWRIWWLSQWANDSAIGPRSPMDALADDGLPAVDAMIKHYQSGQYGDLT